MDGIPDTAKTNAIIENIKSRRSVRTYLDQSVPKGLIEEILDAARYAPSALNKQPWEFIVLTDKELINELSLEIRKTVKKLWVILPLLKLCSKHFRDKLTIWAIRKTAKSNNDTVFYNAPALIFIVGNKKERWAQTDCALAAQNMMLAAQSLGIGSCFIGRGLLLTGNRKFLKKTGLRRGYKIYAALSIGYPKGPFPAAPRRKTENVICWKE